MKLVYLVWMHDGHNRAGCYRGAYEDLADARKRAEKIIEINRKNGFLPTSVNVIEIAAGYSEFMDHYSPTRCFNIVDPRGKQDYTFVEVVEVVCH